MNDRKLIETEIGSPPAETPVSQQGLPEDLLREASKRLAYTALISGGLWLASVALFWYTRTSRASPRFLLDLALVYEVFITLDIGILN